MQMQRDDDRGKVKLFFLIVEQAKLIFPFRNLAEKTHKIVSAGKCSDWILQRRQKVVFLRPHPIEHHRFGAFNMAIHVRKEVDK